MDAKILEDLREQAEDKGQDHLFAFWDDLNPKNQERLFEQIKRIDFGQINAYYSSPDELPQYDYVKAPKIVSAQDVDGKIILKGELMLKAGKLAVVIVAGGQASRMGIDMPKGCYPLSPIKNKTIFQLFAEKIKKTGKLFGIEPELYIMTSEENHEQTIDYFEKNNYHGLDKDKVVFFPQLMRPVVDMDGQILLSDTHSICWSPGGHGGVYQALGEANLFSRMREKGIEYLDYFQVDNPLAKVADPAFLGLCIDRKVDMATKIIEKAYPEERVGHIVEDDEKTFVLEYIHLSEEMVYERDEHDDLLYKAANTAMHFLTRDFAERMSKGKMPVYHAKKKVVCIDENGYHITPLEPNAIKFESFVFDALPFAKKTLNYEVLRKEEFAPVKNAKGRDSPDSAKDMMITTGKRWLLAANIPEKIVDNIEEIEISPLLAVSEEEFVKKISRIHKEFISQIQKKKRVYLS